MPSAHADEQVKIRGYSIELREIEQIVRNHAEVQDAAVVCGDSAGESELGCYIIPKPGTEQEDWGKRLKDWQAFQAKVDPSRLIFLDESGVNTGIYCTP